MIQTGPVLLPLTRLRPEETLLPTGRETATDEARLPETHTIQTTKILVVVSGNDKCLSGTDPKVPLLFLTHRLANKKVLITVICA